MQGQGQVQVQVIYTSNQLIPAVRFKPVKMDTRVSQQQTRWLLWWHWHVGSTCVLPLFVNSYVHWDKTEETAGQLWLSHMLCFRDEGKILKVFVCTTRIFFSSPAQQQFALRLNSTCSALSEEDDLSKDTWKVKSLFIHDVNHGGRFNWLPCGPSPKTVTTPEKCVFI